MNLHAMPEHLKLGLTMFAIVILVLGCRTSNDAVRNPSVIHDPLVGEWQESPQSRGYCNFLHPAIVDVDASIKCNQDGTLIIHEGDKSATYYWQRQTDGRAVVKFAPDADDRDIVAIIKIEGDELIVENQMDRVGFRRVK